jgi:acetylornithine deacetylase/succinyl-diaminopimelate desuccinylase-like protein
MQRTAWINGLFRRNIVARTFAQSTASQAHRTKDMNRTLAVLTLIILATSLPAQSTPASDETRFRGLFKELVETNTTLSAGSCTLAAERMLAHLKAAGLDESNLHLFAAPGHPKEGGLVAIYPGRDPKYQAILLLAHLDVVEAKREDWTRDPFSLVEENGNFYARGVADDKAQAAMWVDTLTRFQEQHFRPLRTVKVALTCGEETSGAFDGAQWLTENQRDLVDAEFAINEGGGGELDAAGHRLVMDVEAGQKIFQNFRVEATNPGGHSSVPRSDNAIYQLAGALKKIEAYTFPPQFIDANRAYFSGMAKIKRAQGDAAVAGAMESLLNNPKDEQAITFVSMKDPGWNSMLRTTCVATMMDAGHATNALPQRARANVNCRIFPGVSIEAVRTKLQEVIGDSTVTVTTLEVNGPIAAPPPLTAKVLGPVQKLSAQFWPGVPVVPYLLQGASDGKYFTTAGIPTYGIAGMFLGPDFGNVHGLNEYLSVQTVMESRDFLYRLVKIYAEQK